MSIGPGGKPSDLPGRASSRRAGGGFTLVELMFVVAIIATLASIAVPSYMRFVDKARSVRATAEIRSLANVIDAHEVGDGTLPDALADIGEDGVLDPWGRPYVYLKIAGNVPRADAAPPPRPRFALAAGPPRLILAAAGGPPSSPNVMGQVRKDRFLVPLNSDYDLYSAGKDGESRPPLSASMSQDDIVRANDGAYIGLASQY